MDSLKPLKLQKWETQGIKIHWSDGHISQYRSGWLRARCPYASCQEEANKPVAQPTGLNLLPVRLEFPILSLNTGRRQRCVPPIVCPTLSRVWKLSCSPCSTWPSRPQSSVGPAACEP